MLETHEDRFSRDRDAAQINSLLGNLLHHLFHHVATFSNSVCVCVLLLCIQYFHILKSTSKCLSFITHKLAGLVTLLKAD